MARGEAGSAKAIGTAMKAKGLTKLRFYCQICQKACRDENGYKCHVESETHMRQIAALGSNSGKVIDNFSKEFLDGFVSLLSRRFGTAKVNANKVYQEYIQDRHHLHMNATRWVSLSEFVKHLGREGLVKVEEITDEGQFGWYVSWVDNSPEALARQDALQKMQRAKVDEEGRQRRFLSQQIERAKEEARKADDEALRQKAEMGLQRDVALGPLKIGLAGSVGVDAEKDTTGGASGGDSETAPAKGDVLSLSAAPKPSSTPAALPFKFAKNPLKMKTTSMPIASSQAKAELPAFGNAFKTAGKPVADLTRREASSGAHRTAAEKIMAEEQAMREKRKAMGPQPSSKRMRN